VLLSLATAMECEGEGEGECQPEDATSLLQVTPASIADRTSSSASSREAFEPSSLVSTEGASKLSSKAAPKHKASSKSSSNAAAKHKGSSKSSSQPAAKHKAWSHVRSDMRSKRLAKMGSKTHTKMLSKASAAKMSAQMHSHGNANMRTGTLSHGKTKACHPPYCWEQDPKPAEPSSTPHSEKGCQDFCGWRTNVNLCIWSCKKALAKGLEGSWASTWSDPYKFGNIAKSWVRRADPVQTWFPSRGGVPQQMGGRWPKVAKGGNDWFSTGPKSAMKNAEKLAKFGLLQEEREEGVKEHGQGAGP